ncbi:P-loop containing nucleoside triphosphate hydrolase protein, partial [Ceratobasidium sp. AG-I]
WYNTTLCKSLGYTKLKKWQLERTMDLCNGKDVFLVVATGEGKSCLIQAPVIADHAAGRLSIGLVLVPTKALADDQARAAKAKKIQGLALHEDSLREARKETPPRDLFTEIKLGKWTLIFLGPEMLTTKPFDDLIHHERFLSRLRYFTIDECHLTSEWKDFRSAYADMSRLRNRFPAGAVVWLALSATIAKRDLPTFLKELGFSSSPQRCTVQRLPVDRQTVTYVPRIRQHATSGEDFLDYTSLIPLSARAASDIPITIIFAQRIELGNRLMRYLTNILPNNIQGEARMRLILPYHSIMSVGYRLDAVEALRLGEQTRVLICTDTGAFGIDITEVQQVVVIVNNSSETYETLCQKHGRIRSTGTAITYFPKWMNTKRNGKDDVRLRSKMQPVMVEYANATSENCPRSVNCRYWGEPVRIPEDVVCCNRHCPDVDVQHYRETETRRKAEKTLTSRQKTARSDGTHRPLGKKTLRPAVFQLLRQWRNTTWCLYSQRTPMCPSNRLISDALLQHLCKRMHACTTIEKFRTTLATWDRLDEFGPRLFEF